MEEWMDLSGKIIRQNETRYRVLGTQDGVTTACEMDTEKLNIVMYKTDDLTCAIRNGVVQMEKEEAVYFNEKAMTKQERDRFNKKTAFLKWVDDTYGPTYAGLMGRSRKETVGRAEETYGLPRSTAYRILIRYLQAGMNPAGVADRRLLVSKNGNPPKETRQFRQKTGAPGSFASGLPLTDELRGRFEEGLQEYRKGREKTFKNAYQGLMAKYYTYPAETGMPRLLPASERPTFAQFYYYCRTHLTKEEKDAIKASAAEVRNARRILIGSSRTDAIHPGWIVEADALEADISIVSDVHPEQAVGRPIVYMMTDVYSSVIVAVSVSFENNSYIGLTNLMMNLADDKVEYAKRYGITIDKRMWPSNFIPHEIRCDRGSDFKSDKFREVCRRLGINRTLETGAMGSMKGIIEQTFHQFQEQARPEWEHKGLITKRFDSNHHREAMITMDTFVRLLINFVVHHNQLVIKDYPVTPDMLKTKGFLPMPVMLWEYGCRKYGTPKPITEAMRPAYAYSLMISASASLGRKGIRFRNLYYFDNDEWLVRKIYSLGKKQGHIAIRYDPRDVARVYYDTGTEIRPAHLNPLIPGNADFAGQTWAEYEEFQKERKRMRSEGVRANEQTEFAQYQMNKVIMDSAATEHLSDTEGIRNARALEKQDRNRDNALAERISSADVNALESGNGPVPRENTDAGTKPDEPDPFEPCSMEEAMREHRKHRRNG